MSIEVRRVFRAVAVLAGLVAAGIGYAFPRQNASSGGTPRAAHSPETIPVTPRAAHSPETIPVTPPELRKFEGMLYGTVVAIRTGPAFNGLFLRVALAQPLGGEPVDLRKFAGKVVPIAVLTTHDMQPQSMELARSFRSISPRETIWADVRAAAGSNHILYARQLGAPGGQPVPTAAAPAPADTPASSENVRRMDAELRSLRRDLAHLQQEVADLRLQTQELQRRAPLQR